MEPTKVHDIHHSVEVDDHVVVWETVFFDWGDRTSTYTGLSCSCGEGYRCQHRDTACQERCSQMNLQWVGEEDFEQDLIDVVARADSGEWIGQQQEGRVGFDVLSSIFEVDKKQISQTAWHLYAEKKLGVSGWMCEPWNEGYLPREDSLPESIDSSSLPYGEAIQGLLHVYSETGTEGAYWGVQDCQHITWISPDVTYAGQTVHLCSDHTRKGIVVEVNDERTVIVQWDNIESLDKQSLDNLLIERWSYDGLHTLASGDHISIYEDDVVVFDAFICLRHFPLFTETANGMWIHNEQIDQDRVQWMNWFSNKLRCVLVKSP